MDLPNQFEEDVCVCFFLLLSRLEKEKTTEEEERTVAKKELWLDCVIKSCDPVRMRVGQQLSRTKADELTMSLAMAAALRNNHTIPGSATRPCSFVPSVAQLMDRTGLNSFLRTALLAGYTHREREIN